MELRTETLNPRSLFEIKYSKNPIDIKKVESASEIVKRFSTGANVFWLY